MWDFPSRGMEIDKPNQNCTEKVVWIIFSQSKYESRESRLEATCLQRQSRVGWKQATRAPLKWDPVAKGWNGEYLHPGGPTLWGGHHPDITFAHLNSQKVKWENTFQVTLTNVVYFGYGSCQVKASCVIRIWPLLPPCCISCWWSQWRWTCRGRGNLQGDWAHAPSPFPHLGSSQVGVSACMNAAKKALPAERKCVNPWNCNNISLGTDDDLVGSKSVG